MKSKTQDQSEKTLATIAKYQEAVRQYASCGEIEDELYYLFDTKIINQRQTATSYSLRDS